MLVLRVARKSTDAGERIEMNLSGDDILPQLQDEPIFFEVHGSEAADVQLCDGFVGGVLHYLMESRQDLHIEGKVSTTCLRNMLAYQRYWSLVRPERCSTVRITADEVVPDRDAPDHLPPVANYSGGIDSTFTILRHCLQLCGMDSVPPQRVAIVQGFDAPLADDEGFARLLDRLQPAIEQFGVRRYIVRTNLKELGLQDWVESYAAQLVACLHTVSDRHSTALIASDGYGQSPAFEYGGNPISVPLLTTSRLKVLYDGSAYGRTEKVRLIAKYPIVERSLKFCFEGADVARNCGRCRKCFLSYLNFRAAGVRNPACFDTPVSEELIEKFVIPNSATATLWYEVFAHLRQIPGLAEDVARFELPLRRFEEELSRQGTTTDRSSSIAFGVSSPSKEALALSAVPTFAERRNMSVRSISALNGGVVSHELGCARIEADPRPWAYSAVLPLEDRTLKVGPARVELRLQVERGRIGVLVLESGSSEQIIGKEQSVGPSTEPRTITLDIPAIEKAGSIVFRGWPNKRRCGTSVFAIAMLSNRDPVAVSEGAGGKRKLRWFRF